MAMNPSGSLTSYCDPSTFFEFIDWRLVGQFCSDDNTLISKGNMLIDPADPTLSNPNPVLGTALLAASGELEAACLMGERYSTADLQALTGASAMYLKEIVAYLAYGRIRGHRGEFDGADDPKVKAAREAVERLKEGGAIFAFDETSKAGLPITSFYSYTDFETLHLASRFARRWLGTRANDYLPGDYRNSPDR